MKKIAVVTADRAEYGILTPLLRRIWSDSGLKLDLIVTGTHLSERHGMTVKFIEEDGFPISHRIPILEEGNTPCHISFTMANALKKFATCFRDDVPEMVVILGDRTEMLGVACAAMNERIPIAHIHGGEITEGAVDDCVRHALTKMSYLHFTSTEEYRKRVIQMGEEPERVFNVGALSTEAILQTSLMDEKEVRRSAGIPANVPYAVVTFHPVTLEAGSESEQTRELCEAMLECRENFFLVTGTNADAGGDTVNHIMKQMVLGRQNIGFIQNLGFIRYLSAVKYADFVLGNSSSGIIEAPVLGTPTVNIGSRQKGRIFPETVIQCEPEQQSIKSAIGSAKLMPHRQVHIYGDGNTSEYIVKQLKEFLNSHNTCVKKQFYDLDLRKGDY